MFGKKKVTPQIDKEQLELIKNAQKRIKQKKSLYVHFVIFLIGAVFLILANTVLGIGETVMFLGLNWFVYAILAWLFLFIYHAFNVFITNRFMGKDWEQKQLDKLVAKQQDKINTLKAKVEKKYPLEVTKEKSIIKTVKNSQLTIIVAAAENNIIGKDNKLIWHLRDDLKRFKALTSGHHIIMGRKTFESFPKPLPNRTHVVITRQANYNAPDGVIVVNSLNDAIDASKNDQYPFIIGGGEIYKEAINIVDKVELTRVHHRFEGDTHFPEIDPLLWKQTQRIDHNKDENHDYDFSFLTYEKL
ncbi:dihydrofolate reductase [Lacinutrix undariae]